MSMLRYALSALAAVGGAAAISCTTTDTYTIQNSGDALALAACSTFTGNIAIATGTTGDIAINSVQRIKGALSIANAPNVTGLSGDSLTNIDDAFTLDNVQVLSSLSFPKLSSVGSVLFNALPNLANLDMATQIQDTSSLSIQNTFLSSLEGINLKECDTFIVANNNFLNTVSLQLKNVSGAITLESNGDRLIVSFPNLEWAQNITFRNVPSISMPSLFAVNGSLGFIENNSLSNITCPALTRVDESLSIITNVDLTDISFPLLSQVKGAVNVQNNTKLGDVQFPKLAKIGGAFDAYGNFTKIELPALNDVRGAFNVQSTGNIDSACTTFKNEAGPNNVIKGTFTCAGEQANPKGAGSTVTSSSGRPGSGAVDLVIPSTALTGVMGVLAAILGML